MTKTNKQKLEETKPRPSELRSVKIWCGACKTEFDAGNARFEVSTPYICAIHNGEDLESYTCHCNHGDKTIEVSCPHCNYFSTIEII